MYEPVVSQSVGQKECVLELDGHQAGSELRELFSQRVFDSSSEALAVKAGVER